MGMLQEICGPLACMLLICVAIISCGRLQFGGADGGFLSNCGWQAYLGHQPYIDFLTATPPLFIIGARLAFVLFGTTQIAFAKISALYTVLVFFVHWRLLKRLPISYSMRVLIALLTAAVSMVEPCFWWYNQLTCMTAAVFLTSVIVILLGHDDRTVWGFFIILAAMVSLELPPVTGPALG